MATINVKNAEGGTESIEKPLPAGRNTPSASKPVVLSTEDIAALTTIHNDLSTLNSTVATATLQGTSNTLLNSINSVAGNIVSELQGELDVALSSTSLDAINAITDKLSSDPATETKQDAANALLTTISSTDFATSAQIGEVQASPTANTVLDRLKTIATALAGSLTVGKTEVVDVTLSLDTSAYSSGDLLADTQIISNATRINDLGGLLTTITVIDKDDQGVAFDIYILDQNVSFGSENSAPTLSDTNAAAILGRIQVLTSDYYDLGGCKVAFLKDQAIALKPLSGTRNIGIAVVNGTGTPTFTASGVVLRLGILQD